jgi:hypothetical protein
MLAFLIQLLLVLWSRLEAENLTLRQQFYGATEKPTPPEAGSIDLNASKKTREKASCNFVWYSSWP